MPSAYRGWPVGAEHRRACPRSVESRNRGNLARSSKDPGLVYLLALDATSAERGCGARGRGLRAWLYVVSFLVLPRVHTHRHARAHTHIHTYIDILIHTSFGSSLIYPHLSDFAPPLCLYRYAVGSRTGEYTPLLSPP